MEIEDASEKDEHVYFEDGGEGIVCPVCGAVWLFEDQGDFTSGDCEHLRFVLHSECDDDFQFSGDWDFGNFIKLVEKAHRKDSEKDIVDIIAEIKHPDIGKAMIFVWQDDPLYHPWTLWGYKEDA